MFVKESQCNSFGCVDLIDDSFLIIKKILFKSKLFYEKLISIMMNLEEQNQFFDIDKMTSDNNIPKKQYQLSKFFNCSVFIKDKLKNIKDNFFFIQDEKIQKELKNIVKKLPVKKYLFFYILFSFLRDNKLMEYSNYSFLHKLCKKLITKYHQENMEIFNHAIECVDKYIMKHYNKLSDVEDLISAGREGVIEALYRYDKTEHKNKFLTYAMYWVMNKFNHEMQTRFPIVYDYKILRSYIMKENKLFDLDDYDKMCLENMSTNITCDMTGLNDEDNKSNYMMEKHILLEKKETSQRELPDIILFEKEQNNILYNAMNTLTDIEKDILIKKFGLNGQDEEDDKKICFTYNIKRRDLNKYLLNIYAKLKNNLSKEMLYD